MVCLLVREDYRRWERWFNEKRQMAIPDHYQARDYVNPYAKSDKGLCPDPPYKAPAKRPSASEPREPREPPMTPEERKLKKRLREAARIRLARLNEAWDRAQIALMERDDDGS